MNLLRGLMQDPERDPRIGAALRSVERPLDEDGSSLRARIVAAAGATTGPRGAREWWEWLNGWRPIAVPAVAVASLAAALVLPRVEVTESAHTVAVATLDTAVTQAVLGEDASSRELVMRLLPESEDAVFGVAQ